MRARQRDTGSAEGWFVAAAVVAIIAIPLAAWGISLLLASPSGKADAYRAKETGVNRVFSQQLFEKNYADIQATKTKITAAAAARTTSAEAEVRYQGLISYCASIVGDYNAAARSYSTQDFRAADLPAQIDASTECEPTS